ncbi:MAG: CPBP family glutamic-type intramembrane protease [Rudaea sp.]
MLTATVAALQKLAQHQFNAWLRHEAAHELVLAATGKTPYRWGFRPDDIVAGRVFSAANFDFTGNALLATSTGQPFEIGLRLLRLLPLRDFPRLRLDAYARTPAQVQIVARETLDGGEWHSVRFTLAGNSTVTQAALDQIQWFAPSGERADIPPKIAMLRFRFYLAQGTALQFHGAELASTPAETVGVTSIHALPADAATRKADIASIAVDSTNRPMPVLLLPQQGRVEQQMLALHEVQNALPAAIVIPQSEYVATRNHADAKIAREEASGTNPLWGWIALGIFGALLIAARLRPPRVPRLRALLEIALVLAVPMWLIIGDRFTGETDARQELLILVSAIYTFSLAWPRSWRWNGSLGAWWLSAAVVAIAVGIGFALHPAHTPLRAIGTGHITRYLAWALLQQYLICVVCTERWRTFTGNRAAAVYLGALGFALLHTPNATLMLATFAGGLCWCALYLRERALLPLAASHAASALLLIALLPPDILLSAEVSARFFQ